VSQDGNEAGVSVRIILDISLIDIEQFVLKTLRVRIFNWVMLIKVCLDHLNEVVGKGKGYSWDVSVQDLRKFFKRPIPRSQLEYRCGIREYIEDTNPEAIVIEPNAVFCAILCD